MDALVIRCAILAAAVASMGASYRTPNFVVNAPTPEMAKQIGDAAEKYRRDLAIEWTGSAMPNWSQPCPIEAQVGPNLGAGGMTSFQFHQGEVYGWTMSIQGSLERILDSVLPHEVTHTIFATHFRRPLPRWADEGACTTVEHASERDKQSRMLIEFLHTNRGIAFSKMFAMREYPRDVMPLYSQGYSLARFLIEQGGKRKFLNYLADGMRDDNWSRATKQHYNFNDLLALQNNWLEWVKQGSPSLHTPDETPALVAVSPPPRQPRPDDAVPVARTEAFPPESDDAEFTPVANNGRSVYELAAAGGKLPRGNHDPDAAWRRRGETGKSPAHPAPSDLASYEPVESFAGVSAAQTAEARIEAPADKLPGPAHQVTRPQEFQRPRQVILEWSRPPGSPPTTTASRDLPGPL
jgi:hypothetical protein